MLSLDAVEEDYEQEEDFGPPDDDIEGGEEPIGEPEDAAEEDDDFYENLALVWDEAVLERIGSDLCEAVQRDRDARQLRDKQQEDGLKRTGMGAEAPGGANFEGASRVTHPVITTCTIDFAARSIKEVFPPEGPVKTAIIGQTTKGRLDRAERIRRHMNVQLTRDIVEYRAELERLLTQLPMGGSQYLKWYWDKRLRRPRCDFIPIDNVFLPYHASSLYSADRVTHWQKLTDLEYDRRVKTELYRDLDTLKGSLADSEKTYSERANEKIEGKSDQAAQGDEDLHEVYEIYTYLEEDDDKAGHEFGPCPYIVHVSVDDSKVLGIYRNWEDGDPTYKAIDWLVEFGFIPWRGAYCVGLPHLIGGLSAAATGALRALLDSAHINNAPTALKLKGGRVGGQSQQVSIGTVNEIDGGPIDDIKKIAMPMPFNPPSQVLFELLGALDQMARGVVRTVLEDESNQGAEVPVGTQLSRVENGMVVFSAIHSRLHAAQRKCLEILFRLNRQYLDDQSILDEFGEVLVRRQDYEGAMDVMPVSDPHIFSEAQRFAQNQGIVQMAATAPDLYNMRAVHKRVLETMRIPNVDEILPPPPQPVPQNAVTENVQMMMGKPAFAFPDQDHLAHIQVLLSCVQDPNYGGNPIIGATFIPAALEHLKQHLAFWYAQQMLEIASQSSGIDLSELPYSIEGLGNKLDQLLAHTSQLFHKTSPAALQNIPPAIQQAIQFVQQIQPQQQDPNIIVAQAAMQDAQTRAQKAQAEVQTKQAELQAAQQKLQIEQQTKQAQMANDAQLNTQDNQTDLQIAAMKENNKSASEQANREHQMAMKPAEQPQESPLGKTAREQVVTTNAIMETIIEATQNLAQGIAEQGKALAEGIKEQGDKIAQQNAETTAGLAQNLAQQSEIMLAALTAPREVITDKRGNVVGSKIMLNGSGETHG